MVEKSSKGPVWDAAAGPQEFVPLREDLEADVCVVGGGIAGTSVAYELAADGARVVLLESAAVGAGTTGVTTAHLASAMDDRFVNLERLHGRDGARLTRESNQAAIDRIARIAEDEGFDCDYRRLDGYLMLAPDQPRDFLEQELEAARRAGFEGAAMVEGLPGGGSGPAIRFPGQARFHPLRYLDGLTRAIHRRGGRIFTGTHVSELGGGRQAFARSTEGHTVRADSLVVATNSPINDIFAIHTKQAPYITYVIAARVEGEFPDMLLWDTADPYHYVRLQEVPGDGGPHQVLIVGGEDHHTGEPREPGESHARLEAWAREHWQLGPVEFAWSGQVYEPVDYLPYIGVNPGLEPNVYVVTGDSGQGITHGVVAGMLIADLIAGRENPWEKLFDPSRISLRAAPEFTRINLQVAGHYLDWITGTDDEVASTDDIAPGAGAVIRRGALPVAVYRDEEGILHERSAVCTHLGCIVHWNADEKQWNCPCHGSRFDAKGSVVNGPASSDLAPAPTAEP